MLRVGLIGTGVMGGMIARAIDHRSDFDLVAVSDLDRPRADQLVSGLRHAPVIVDPDALVRESDLVVEAASAAAVEEILPLVIAHRTDLMVLSVGGLIAADGWIQAARDQGVRIYCPSGAIAGLDAVKAAAVGTIERVEITTRKPPEGFAGAPYLVERAIDISRIQSPKVVFEGSAREACRAFPANINVAATLSLAGIGVDRTRVKLIADPGVTQNIHEIEVIGDSGRIYTVTENVPSANPKTSRLAADSAIARLESLASTLQIGT